MVTLERINELIAQLDSKTSSIDQSLPIVVALRRMQPQLERLYNDGYSRDAIAAFLSTELEERVTPYELSKVLPEPPTKKRSSAKKKKPASASGTVQNRPEIPTATEPKIPDTPLSLSEETAEKENMPGEAAETVDEAINDEEEILPQGEAEAETADPPPVQEEEHREHQSTPEHPKKRGFWS